MESEVEVKILIFAPDEDNAGDGRLTVSEAEEQLAELFNDDWGIRTSTGTEDYVVMVLQRAKKSAPKSMGFLVRQDEEA